MEQLSGVGVLDKAVALLDAVERGPLTLSELVARTGLSRATAHRLAVALQTHRLLGRDAAGRFVPGPRLAAGGSLGLPAALLRELPGVLAGLRDATGESSQLYARRGALRVCVAAAERASGLRDTVPVGSTLPMTAGSGAQVLLAFDPDPDPALLARAVFSSAVLAEVRARGWAASAGEREEGLASLSAPVRDATGLVVAAVSVSGPAERLHRAAATPPAELLAAAARLSELAGAASAFDAPSWP